MSAHFLERPAFAVWTLVTSAFSHKSMAHLYCNLHTLHACGTNLSSILFPSYFTAIYISAAAFSNLTAYLVYAITEQGGRPCLGASGATIALIAVEARVYADVQVEGRPFSETLGSL